MTLYLWMHWFWITFSMYLIVHSQPTVMSTSTSSHRYFVNESSIPPTTPFLNQTSIFTEKPSKLTLKKHLNKNNVTTPSPVIDQNFTFPSVDNDTLIMTNQSYFDNDTLQELVERNISQSNLSAAGITGITVGCIGIVGIVCGVSFIVYNRNRGLNRPQVLNDRCSNPDSSGYIDDASIRDNSEEMYSLDNDSFLNSLEAMTIQNYWTDTVKHTKL